MISVATMNPMSAVLIPAAPMVAGLFVGWGSGVLFAKGRKAVAVVNFLGYVVLSAAYHILLAIVLK